MLQRALSSQKYRVGVNDHRDSIFLYQSKFIFMAEFISQRCVLLPKLPDLRRVL